MLSSSAFCRRGEGGAARRYGEGVIIWRCPASWQARTPPRGFRVWGLGFSLSAHDTSGLQTCQTCPPRYFAIASSTRAGLPYMHQQPTCASLNRPLVEWHESTRASLCSEAQGADRAAWRNTPRVETGSLSRTPTDLSKASSCQPMPPTCKAPARACSFALSRLGCWLPSCHKPVCRWVHHAVVLAPGQAVTTPPPAWFARILLACAAPPWACQARVPRGHAER